MCKKSIRVVAAIICRGNFVFATQRGYGNYKDWWEFPGGKIEQDESPEEAIVREIREELNTEIVVDGFLTTIDYDYPEFHLTMDCFWCSVVEGNLQLLEHEAAKWLPMNDLWQVNWLPADVLVVEAIEKRIRTNDNKTVCMREPIDQIERIKYYENLLNETTAVLKEFEKAFNSYIGIQSKISELDTYYTSLEWKEDFKASEKDELPKDLLCGVLSEDGIDHVLEDNQQLLAQCRKVDELLEEDKDA